MEIEHDVVIVGGGIAGVATALGLHRIGIRSLVLERSNQLRAIGGALTLAPNAWAALDALGVFDKLASIYTPFQRGYITDVTKGTVQQVDYHYAGKDKERTGLLRSVHRSTLLQILAQELPAETIRFCSKLSSIETLNHQGSSITVLRLEDVTIIKAKMVIGCDGVHSVVGRWLGLKSPRNSGRFAVRGLSVFPRGHGLKHEINQFVDGDNRAGFVPLNDKELYWFTACKSITPTKGEDVKRQSPEMVQKNVLENMANYPPSFLNAVRNSELSTLTWSPFMFRPPWEIIFGGQLYKDNITVAGDAMHPMTPDLGQGGCAALEDAVVLARHIGNSWAQIGMIDSRALKGYVEERRWRWAMIISASYLSGWIQQGGSGWFMGFLRDRVFYRFFPRLTQNVIQYDCGELPAASFTAEGNMMKKSK